MDSCEFRQEKRIDTSIRKIAPRCSISKVFLNILQNSQENTCYSLFQLRCAPICCNFIKNRIHQSVFVRICNMFKNSLLKEHLLATVSDKMWFIVFNIFFNTEILLSEVGQTKAIRSKNSVFSDYTFFYLYVY